MSILEASHRSEQFLALVQDTEARIRTLLRIPESYAVLFMPGGGTGQFAAVPLNLAAKTDPLVYLISGNWSSQAASEAKQLGYTQVVELPIVTNKTRWSPIFPESSLKAQPKYVYYCDNETIEGIELLSIDQIKNAFPTVPVVCDMSSNFLTKPIPIEQYGCIFATAQKNFGPAGVTVVIVKRDLLPPNQEPIPKIMDYQLFDRHMSLYNTPPCFAIYIVNLVLIWIEETFATLDTVNDFSKSKSSRLYAIIDGSCGRFFNNIEAKLRSRMNVVFRIMGDDGCTPDIYREEQFLQRAESLGLLQLKGHRSVGGIRASLYNGISMQDTERLALFMCEYLQETGHRPIS